MVSKANAGSAIGYVRVSRVGSRSGDSFISPDLQRASIERICEREGLTLLDVVEELDASAGQGKSRPGWDSVIERIERGEAEALLVWNLDRFSRSITDGFKAIERIEAAGGRLISEDGATSKLDRGIRLLLGDVPRPGQGIVSQEHRLGNRAWRVHIGSDFLRVPA